ncbi:hypothetical protein [Methylobacterium mesophilicum]
MTQISHALAVGWTAYSFGATVAGLGGAGLIVLGLLATAYLPAFIRRPLIAAGIALLAGAALFQAGQAKGVHEAAAAEAARNLAQAKADAAATLAEQARQAAAAKDIAAKDKDRADAAEADAQASASRLRDLQAYLKGTKDRPCGSADDARRLRAL